MNSNCKLLFQQLIKYTRATGKRNRSTLDSVTTDALHYTIKEIQIPAPGGYIAGKLWEPAEKSSKKTLVRENEQPPIMCLHGWLDNAGSFDGVLPLIMKQNRKFFAMDLPGHGFTTYCPTSHYDGLMEGLISVKRASKFFGWEKFSLFGHSMGSIISFLYSGLFPEEVHKYVALENLRPLVLRDTLDMMRSSLNLVFEVEERIAKTSNKYYTYEQILKRFYDGRMETISVEGCKVLLKRGAVMHEEGKYKFSHNLRTLIPPAKSFSEQESLEIAKEIKCPVCVIKGDPGNVYETTETWDVFIKALKESSKSVEVHSIPGTHHFHVNDPELVAPVVNKFLDS